MQREEKDKLKVLGTFLTKYPNTTAVIEGHTDNVGDAADNMRLSQRRADNVVSYLADNLHIAKARLVAVGYGETRPVADNGTEEGKRANRRIDAVVACATDVEGLTVKPARVTMALLVEFDRNMADVKPQYHDDLRTVAEFLKAHPNVTATVEGHTANTQASPELALEISQRRAQNILNYLVNNFGIERSRLTAEGFGDTRRFAYNTTFEGSRKTAGSTSSSITGNDAGRSRHCGRLIAGRRRARGAWGRPGERSDGADTRSCGSRSNRCKMGRLTKG